MSASALLNVDELEPDLWEAADQLRANSKLTSSEYCMPARNLLLPRLMSGEIAV